MSAQTDPRCLYLQIDHYHNIMNPCLKMKKLLLLHYYNNIKLMLLLSTDPMWAVCLCSWQCNALLENYLLSNSQLTNSKFILFMHLSFAFKIDVPWSFLWFALGKQVWLLKIFPASNGQIIFFLPDSQLRTQEPEKRKEMDTWFTIEIEWQQPMTKYGYKHFKIRS